MQVKLYSHIVADSDVLAGKPVVEGTNVLASTLVGAVAAGKDIPQVAREFGISEEDVRAALEYAAQRVGEEVELSDPLFALAGIFSSDDPDWVDQHDQYLAEEYAKTHADEQ